MQKRFALIADLSAEQQLSRRSAHSSGCTHETTCIVIIVIPIVIFIFIMIIMIIQTMMYYYVFVSEEKSQLARKYQKSTALIVCKFP